MNIIFQNFIGKYKCHKNNELIMFVCKQIQDIQFKRYAHYSYQTDSQETDVAIHYQIKSGTHNLLRDLIF